MLKLTITSNHSAELCFNNYTILFSYETPVALFDHSNRKYSVVQGQWSKTTTKHIDKFLGEGDVEKTITPDQMNNLINASFGHQH